MANRHDWQTNVLAYKVEGTEGSAEALTNAEAGVLVENPDLTPDDVYEEDNSISDSPSPFPGSVGGITSGTLTFRTPFYGSGTKDTAPNWGGLLKACRYSESVNAGTSVTYLPSTSDASSYTFGFYVDGLYYQMCGSRGDVSFDFTSGKRGYMNYSFKGKYAEMDDSAILTGITWPLAASIIPPSWIAGGFTYDSEDMLASSLSIQTNNGLEIRQKPGAAGGMLSCAITGKRHMTGGMDPEAVTKATKDWHAAHSAETRAELAWELGSATGNWITFSAPKAQIRQLNPSQRGNIHTHEFDLEFIRSGGNGNDELLITHK